MKEPRTGREHDLVVRAREGDGEALRHHLLTEKRAGGREVTRGARPNSSAFRGREPSPSEVAIGEETRRRAAEALSELPEDHREVLALVQVEGLTLADAAVRMGRSYEATKKLYGRAASRLAKGMATGRDT